MIRTQGDGGMVSRRLSISTHAVSMAGAALLSFGSFCVPVAAADETADAISKELANPNNDLAKLTFKNQYRRYTGDLPSANEQGNYTLLFQPVFPFGLGTTDAGDKKVFFLRPALPFMVDQPYFDPDHGNFGGRTALGDIGFDVALGLTRKSGWLYAAGVVGTLPTATSSDVGGGQWRLGPEALVAHVSRWGVLGFFPSHHWNVGGWKKESYSTSTLQVFAVHTAGDGWAYGTQPIMNYNWETSNWTLPLQAYVSKTVIIGGTPVKFDFELNYYIKQEVAFGPRWMVGFNITPVVHNFVAAMFSKK